MALSSKTPKFPEYNLVIVFWHKCDFSIFEYGLVIFCFDFVGRKCNFLSFYVA